MEMFMTNRTSIALTIDVEPDERRYDPASRPRWIGFETLLAEIPHFRAQLAKASGAPVHFTWLLRLDQQIKRTYGRPDWPLEQYRREIGELRNAGDEIGVHTHSWRWDEVGGDWVAEHGDPAWVGRCVDESLATYRQATGRPARAFIHGDHFLSNDVIRRLDRAGVVCDMTLVPGQGAMTQMLARERATGSLPDFGCVPRVPYRPSSTDFKQPGVMRRRRLWMAPVTSGILANPLTGSLDPHCQALLLGAPFSVVRQVFEGYLATCPLPMVVTTGRTDVLLDDFNGEQFRQFLTYLAEHPRRREWIFETSVEAVQRYASTLKERGYGRRRAAQFALSTRFAEPIARNAPAPVAVEPQVDAAPGCEQLLRNLAVERSFSRTLAEVAQKLREQLTAIEGSRLWRWRRRWQQLRALLGSAMSGPTGSLLKRFLSLATKAGRRRLRHIAKLIFKKAYLLLEDEPVEIVVRSAGAPMRTRHALLTTYENWLAKRAPRPVELLEYRERLSDLPYRPKISVLMPVFNPPIEFLRQAIQSVCDQVYPDWELCIADDASTDPRVRTLLAEFARSDPRIAVEYRTRNGHISAASNSALALATGEFCALLDHDDVLTPDALYQMAVALARQPDLDVLYSDEDKIDEAGQFCDPHFKPQWCPDTLLAGNYLCHLLTVRTKLLHAAGRFRAGFEGAQDFDLVLRLTERTDRIHHVPRVLYHWRRHDRSTAKTMTAKPYAIQAGVMALQEALTRRGEPGTVEPHPEAFGQYCVRYDLCRPGRVGIVIPTRDRADLLAVCLRSLFQRTDYADFEVLVVDNGSQDPRTFALFDETRARYPDRFAVLRDDGAFNFSRLVNRGVRAVAGAYVLLLNNDVEAIDPGWLAAMVRQAQRPSIGCVGARLLFPDGTVQHAGVVVGRGAAATNVFHRAANSALGQGNRLRTVANYSAVTAACLLVRREIFEKVGGFDECFAVDLNDVDFCLRVREAGYHNIFVPGAELIHHESATRGHPCATPESSRRLQAEAAAFRERWPHYIACDPCVSPHLEPRDGDLQIAA
jgi:GT2 family glycosyltransferase